jgi:hypothetical protein
VGEIRNSRRILVEKSVDEDGRILKWTLKYRVGHVEWIHVAENRVQWRAL